MTLGVGLPVPPGAVDPEATEVLPRVADDPPTDPLQTPAAPLGRGGRIQITAGPGMTATLPHQLLQLLAQSDEEPQHYTPRKPAHPVPRRTPPQHHPTEQLPPKNALASAPHDVAYGQLAAPAGGGQEQPAFVEDLRGADESVRTTAHTSSVSAQGWPAAESQADAEPSN